MKIASGNKAAITFAVSAITGRFTMIGGVEKELGDEDVSSLESDEYAEFELHDLATMSETECELFLDTEAAAIALGQKELITITAPTLDGQATPASFAAWGGIKKVSLPEWVNNTKLKQRITIKWLNRDASGTQVKPAWTAATLTP